jgi:membrane protein implicated in regulation of membrane protease activity
VPSYSNWVLIVVGALLVLLEVVLGAISGFDLLLVGTAILLGGIIGLVVDSPAIGAATAGVLALLYVLLGRRHVRSRWARPNVPTNVDALMGRTGMVVETIGPEQPGRVRIDGEEWRARLASDDLGQIEEGRTVLVGNIDGVTLFVRPAATGGSTR